MDSYSGSNADAMAMMSGMMGVFLIVGLVCLAFWVFIWWKIFTKAGYNGALALINLAVIIPLIGWIAPLALTIWFAFSEWPLEKRAKNPGQTFT